MKSLTASMIEFPTFSVIIPTYQRQYDLARCLSALEKLDYPKEKFEVIVINDGGELKENFLSPFQAKLNLTLLHQKNSGPATARNNGARSAKNDYLAFTDDDCCPDTNWLRLFAAQFRLFPCRMLGGLTINALEKNIYSTASQALVDYLYNYADLTNSNVSFLTSNNIAVPRAEFLSIGGFDESFERPAAEDRDLTCRWIEKHYEKNYLDTAIVYHHHNLRWKSFCRQQYNYGCGAYHFYALRKLRNNQKIRIKLLRFHIKMFFFPFIKFPLMRAALISGLFFIGQTAVAIGYFREALKTNKYDHS